MPIEPHAQIPRLNHGTSDKLLSDKLLSDFSDSVAKNIQARTFGDTAIVAFEHLFKTRIVADDSRWQVHIRTTSVLHRKETKWRIVHEHSSPIRGVQRLTQIKD